MKYLKAIEKFLEENNEPEILILIPLEIKIPFIDLLEEQIWKDSAVEKRIKIRVEKHNDGFRHVHISRPEHIHTKSKQVSWNDNGTIHDKGSFNHNFDGIERAKNAARSALNLSDNIVLEEYTGADKEILILESYQIASLIDGIIILIAKNTTGKQLLLD
jgi:hypothetical protein